jgi:Flp pilus assembly protein TadG
MLYEGCAGNDSYSKQQTYSSCTELLTWMQQDVSQNDEETIVCPYSPPKNGHKGQTLVEFAFILPIVLLLLLGVIQVILVGGAALAVNQSAVACARYAALNPAATQTTVNSYLKTVASPLINDSNLQSLTLSAVPPRVTGTPVAVTVTYNLSGKLFLGSSFFGITFPTQVSVTQTMTSE